MKKAILLLSGTSEGPVLAQALLEAGVGPIVATVTREEARAHLFGHLQEAIDVRVQGFTAEGLTDFLVQHRIDLVLDATHPFAVRITRMAASVCRQLGTPYVRYERPDWEPPAGTVFVDSYAEAAQALPSLGSRIMLTIGAKQLKHFTALHEQLHLFARILPSPVSVQQALDAGFTQAHILALRPPFSKAFNRSLLEEYRAEVLVTKASGADGGVVEKVMAAQELGLTTLMIRRPEAYHHQAVASPRLRLKLVVTHFLRRIKGGIMRVAVPGTCGELVQGTLDGIPCLVSCPIAAYSVAEVDIRDGIEAGWVLPPHLVKAAAALRHGLTYLDLLDSSGCVHLDANLPHGRGYGSSTADIGATLFALGHTAGRPLQPVDVAHLALRVEPTDGSLFPGWVLWDHRGGQICEDLGAPPLLSVMVLDPGGKVDTVAFNRQAHEPMLRSLAPQHRDAFTLLQEGIKHGDTATIGAAATLSAVAHQAILPNPLLEVALGLVRDTGAVGVCRAHSGTILGLLMDPRDTEMSDACSLARQRCPERVNIRSLSVIGGGPRPLTSEGV